jgi:hypothetical protein
LGPIHAEIKIRTYKVSEDGKLLAFEADEVKKDPDGQSHFSYDGATGLGSWYSDLLPENRGGWFEVVPKPDAKNPLWFEGRFTNDKRNHDWTDHWSRPFKIQLIE